MIPVRLLLSCVIWFPYFTLETFLMCLWTLVSALIKSRALNAVWKLWACHWSLLPVGFTVCCGWTILLENFDISVFRSFCLPCSYPPRKALSVSCLQVQVWWLHLWKPSGEEGWSSRYLRCKCPLFPLCPVLFPLPLVVPGVPWTSGSPSLPIQIANAHFIPAVDSTASQVEFDQASLLSSPPVPHLQRW